jgi:hypothetical protein
MRIHIEGDLYISGTGVGYTIDRLSVRPVKHKKTGVVEAKEVYETVKCGNFATLSGAVNGLLNLKTQESTAHTLGELLQEIKEYKSFVQSKIEV